jgi:hypothetical protein
MYYFPRDRIPKSPNLHQTVPSSSHDRHDLRQHIFKLGAVAAGRVVVLPADPHDPPRGGDLALALRLVVRRT